LASTGEPGQAVDDKDDTREAVGALHETLALNPRSADAWFLLGRIAVRTFDFPSAARAAAHLRALNPTHPLADLLLAESWLVQDDPDSAQELIEPLLERLPKLRQAHALHAATHAIFYDEPAMFAALDAFDALSPGSAMAHAVVGRHLSLNRQYELAAEILEQAIERQPNWPAPQIELGLMELQAGRDSNARHALRAVTQLDPFNKRAANSLLLLEELADYNRIETEHFIIRYKPGIDEVMVRMMPEKLEEIHRTVSGRFEFEPDRKTIIELMPDHQRFAVRITGMPFIHTIAACTGPVIAMEVPRVGRQGMHSGLYDWPRVLQHEYTHTITLAQTRNRIPHWLTEAAAVEMELSPRDYNTAQMLARSFEQGTLFDLDEIKWAFVRPRQPGDRSKAYAQGHWMLEYMNERFGDDAVIRLLERYFEGERERDAMPSALGVSREAFFEDFLLWAERQVRQWGLAASPTIRELMETHQRTDPDMIEAMRAARQQNLQAIADAVADRIGRGGEGEPLRGEQWPRARMPQVDVDDALLSGWLADHPDHPDLVELKLRRALRDGVEGEPLLALLHRYANLRPLDPFPHQQLARLYLESEEPWRAIEHLETLDQHEQYSPVYAVQLARLYRQAGELELAMAMATRALHIDPYRPANRELAAAIAVQLQQYDIALMHIEALTMLEPDRPQHARRLDAIKRLAN
jgi:tetratricopeptide (TPR) repeat protein